MHQHVVIYDMHQHWETQGRSYSMQQQEHEQIFSCSCYLFMLLFLRDIFYFLFHVLRSFVCSFSALFSSHTKCEASIHVLHTKPALTHVLPAVTCKATATCMCVTSRANLAIYRNVHTYRCSDARWLLQRLGR